jgi:hypothetical protein
MGTGQKEGHAGLGVRTLLGESGIIKTGTKKSPLRMASTGFGVYFKNGVNR